MIIEIWAKSPDREDYVFAERGNYAQSYRGENP